MLCDLLLPLLHGFPQHEFECAKQGGGAGVENKKINLLILDNLR